MKLLIEKYLREKEIEFYPEEEKEEPEDSIVEPEEDYGLDFMDNSFDSEEIEVEEIPDNSDPILNADEFMYSNTDNQTFYARGNGSDIPDNQDFYEVIKLVKDMTDKHIYVRDMVWKVDIIRRRAIFNFTVGDDEESIEVNDFFLQGIQQHLLRNMWKQFGALYKIDTKFVKDNEGRDMMRIEVYKDDEDEERKELKPIEVQPTDSSAFISKSSVSRM